MPRIRTLKPEFFTSPDVAAVEPLCRLFYQALWCWADDFGIGETNFNGLLGFAFPDGDQIYDPELRQFRAVSAPDVRRFCADCARHFETTFYTVRGRHYYAVKTWDAHQKTERREQRRKNPLPDDPDAVPDQRIYGGADFAPDMPRKNGADSRKMCAGTGEQGNRGTGEVGTGEVEIPRKRGTRLKPDWRPTQTTIDAIKAECPNTDLHTEHRKFVDYWTAKTGKDATKLDWEATWRNWMRNARPSPTAPTTSVVDSKVNGWLELAQAQPNLEVGA
jgi:hypothetical protein